MATKGYQLICPKSNSTTKYSSLAIDNITDLFPEQTTGSYGNKIGWEVKKFPNGIEDYTDWMCRASEITVNQTEYNTDADGNTTSRLFTGSFKTNDAGAGMSHPILRTNASYYFAPYSTSDTLGDPKIKKHNDNSISMGGVIDLYNSSNVYDSRYNAIFEPAVRYPDTGEFGLAGSVGSGFILQPVYIEVVPFIIYTYTPFIYLPMFLFKGEFYAAWSLEYYGYLGVDTFTIGSKSLTFMSKTEDGTFSRKVEYTITDTFA